MYLAKVYSQFVETISALDQANISLFRILPSRIKHRFIQKLTRSFYRLLKNQALESNGIYYFAHSASSWLTIVLGNEAMVKLMKKYLRPGMVMVDVGANIGYHSLFAAKLVGAHGKVYAVEPARPNLELLEKNIHYNKFSNVTVLPYAAGPTRQNKNFYLRTASGSHSLFQNDKHTHETVQTVKVEEIPLDELITEHVDLIKMDVEGAEVDALQGMEQILQSPNVRLLVEWYPLLRPDSPQALPEFLLAKGFSVFIIEDNFLQLQTSQEIEKHTQILMTSGSLVNLFAERIAL